MKIASALLTTARGCLFGFLSIVLFKKTVHSEETNQGRGLSARATFLFLWVVGVNKPDQSRLDAARNRRIIPLTQNYKEAMRMPKHFTSLSSASSRQLRPLTAEQSMLQLQTQCVEFSEHTDRRIYWLITVRIPKSFRLDWIS